MLTQRAVAASPAWHAPLSWTGALRPPAIVAGCLLDGISVFQGPNYCLAKSLQEWRAIAARHRGAIVSANVASAARTESVVSSTSAAAALEGMQALFPPFVAFDEDVARLVMAALLLWDLGADGAATAGDVGHVMDVPARNSVHGGIDRIPYSMDSAGNFGVVAGRLFVKHGLCPEGLLAELKKEERLTTGNEKNGSGICGMV